MQICKKCGKPFLKKVDHQYFCYDPCIPLVPNEDLFDASTVRKDCIMFHTAGDKIYCSGLQEVYCGYGPCKFYKRRNADE